jgi:hypothetical protein
MRPIAWGLLISVIGGIGWLTAVVFVAFTLGHSFKIIANIFGIMMLGGIPAGVVGEFFRRHTSHGRKK